MVVLCHWWVVGKVDSSSESLSEGSGEGNSSGHSLFGESGMNIVSYGGRFKICFFYFLFCIIYWRC